jgi:glutamyl-tRNA reductase
VTSPELAPLVAIVLHARDVSSLDREAFADRAASLARHPGAVIVHTCHRVELYGWVPALAGLALPWMPAGGRRLEGDEAARHLFTVASGLDSVVVGEDQILHQLRGCLAARHDEAAERAATCPEGGAAGAIGAAHAERSHGDVHLDPVLDRLFQLSLHVGREAHAWREGTPRSLADVALDRIAREAPTLAGRPVLVVGAGRMGRLAAQTAGRRHAAVHVANRSADRAAALAAEIGGSHVPYAAGDALPAVDGIIIAVGGAWPPDTATADRLVRSGAVVVDLSSPPAIPEPLQRTLGDRFVSVDDLARTPEAMPHERLRRRVSRLVDSAVDSLASWIRTRAAVPAIRAISERAEARRSAELERLLRRMPALEADERELLEQMSHRIVAGILHAPLAALREDADGERERVARELFGL